MASEDKHECEFSLVLEAQTANMRRLISDLERFRKALEKIRDYRGSVTVAEWDGPSVYQKAIAEGALGTNILLRGGI